MFIIAKKKTLIIIALIVVASVLTLVIGVTVPATRFTDDAKTVVLDAGHGGIDNGARGRVTKTGEAEINLDIVLRLQKMLEKEGIRVVLTRKDANGLYDKVDGFKLRDMQARKKIIEDTKPDLVVSVHCNVFPVSARRGAQVFYYGMSVDGKRLANSLQTTLNELNRTTCGKTYSALSADYYMLNCSVYPSALAECGFLSNPEDEALLCTEKYRETVAYALFSGINGYLHSPLTAP